MVKKLIGAAGGRVYEPLNTFCPCIAQTKVNRDKSMESSNNNDKVDNQDEWQEKVKAEAKKFSGSVLTEEQRRILDVAIEQIDYARERL